MHPQTKNFLLSVLYFLLATVLSGVFINNNLTLYSSVNAMILSGSIAGAKWMIQILAALLILKELKWIFIRRIGFICFIGSAILFVYYIIHFFKLQLNVISPFIISIGLSVLVMIVMYYIAVKKTELSIVWFWVWMLCLAIAIMLQMFVVF